MMRVPLTKVALVDQGASPVREAARETLATEVDRALGSIAGGADAGSGGEPGRRARPEGLVRDEAEQVRRVRDHGARFTVHGSRQRPSEGALGGKGEYGDGCQVQPDS